VRELAQAPVPSPNNQRSSFHITSREVVGDIAVGAAVAIGLLTGGIADFFVVVLAI
jgi:hypothetical protein